MPLYCLLVWLQLWQCPSILQTPTSRLLLCKALSPFYTQALKNQRKCCDIEHLIPLSSVSQLFLIPTPYKYISYRYGYI